MGCTGPTVIGGLKTLAVISGEQSPSLRMNVRHGHSFLACSPLGHLSYKERFIGRGRAPECLQTPCLAACETRYFPWLAPARAHVYAIVQFRLQGSG